MTANQDATLKALGTGILAAIPATAWLLFFGWARKELPRYLYAPLGFTGVAGAYLLWISLMLAALSALSKVSRERIGGSR